MVAICVFCNLNADKLFNKINEEPSCCSEVSPAVERAAWAGGEAGRLTSLKGLQSFPLLKHRLSMSLAPLLLRGLWGGLRLECWSGFFFWHPQVKSEHWDMGLIFCCTWWQCRDSPQLERNVRKLLTVRGQYQISNPNISAMLLLLRVLGDGMLKLSPFFSLTVYRI